MTSLISPKTLCLLATTMMLIQSTLQDNQVDTSNSFVNYDPTNKTVVVTGGARGIGYEIANSFLEHGAKRIIILDIDDVTAIESTKTLNNKYGENKVVFLHCDVTTDLEYTSAKIFSEYSVDVLVNNAGIIEESSMEKTLATNLISVIQWSLKFREHMRTNKGGKGGTIINISSTGGFRPDAFFLFYKATKFGVFGFSTCLGDEVNYKNSNVRILTICPGFTRTKLVENVSPWDEHKKEYEQFVSTRIFQSAESCGRATLDIYKNGVTGGAWVVEGGKWESIPLIKK